MPFTLVLSLSYIHSFYPPPSPRHSTSIFSLNETKNSLQQHLSVTKNENKLLNESISNLREIISFLGEQSGKNQSGMISTISNYLDEETHKQDKILTNRLNDTYKGFSQGTCL